MMACLFVHCFPLQLSNTKAQDGKTTLLHFLANVVETKHPDVLYFAEEISHIDKASRGENRKYCKTCVKRPLSKRLKNDFQDRLPLNAGQKCCRMLQRDLFSYHLSLRSLFCLFLSGSFTPVLL